MHSHARQYVENKKETLLYQIEKSEENFNNLKDLLDELDISDQQWEEIDKLCTIFYLSMNEVKDEIFSL